MSKIDDILNFITNNPNSTPKEIKNNLDYAINTIRWSVRTLHNRGMLSKTKEGRSYSYSLVEDEKGESQDDYVEFLYTIRITDTHKAKKKNKWDPSNDLVLNMRGTAPRNMTPEMIADRFQDRLFQEGRDILDQNGVLPRYSSKGNVAVDDSDINYQNESKGVEGVQLGDFVPSYDPSYEIDVEFNKSDGSKYNKNNGWATSLNYTLDKWL